MSHPQSYNGWHMKMTNPIQHQSNHSHVTINRLGSVEEELTDRIVREPNGKMIFQFCERLAEALVRTYAKNEGDISSLREKLCESLITSLQCTRQEAICVIELALELVHAKIHGAYRRSQVDLSLVISTASGAVREVSYN